MLAKTFMQCWRRKSLEKDKLIGYLNICHKAGYLIIGGETLENYNKKLYLVIYDKNSQKNTIKIVEKLKNKQIPCVEVENLGEITKINNCKIVGIKNKNLSEIILGLIR